MCSSLSLEIEAAGSLYISTPGLEVIHVVVTCRHEFETRKVWKPERAYHSKVLRSMPWRVGVVRKQEGQILN